jgi:hypothetical protein
MLDSANWEGRAMIGEPARWSDEVDEVIRGDLTAAAAYLTPAGGTVVTAVAPMGRAAGRIAALPHRVLAYRGADGLPVVVPVELAGHDAAGLRLVASAGLLPPGGRRAGLLAHSYRPQLVGLSTRTFTGWLDVTSKGTAVYAPHTSKGFIAPPAKKLLLVSNGLFAKYGMWQASRQGVAERLERLAARHDGRLEDSKA